MIIVVVALYLYVNQPDSNMIDTGKRGNLFPPLSKTPVDRTSGKLDKDFGPGWIGSAYTVRYAGDIQNSPSGDPFHFIVPMSGDTLSATISDLVIGRSYTLGVYVMCVYDDTVFGVTIDNRVLVPNMTLVRDHGFVKVGPVHTQATSTSHTIRFCNNTTTNPNVLTPHYSPIHLTGLLFEWTTQASINSATPSGTR